MFSIGKKMDWLSMVGLMHRNFGYSSTITLLCRIIIGGSRLCSISLIYRELLINRIDTVAVIRQSYATVACTTGVSGIIPKSSEKGVTLTVISVLYRMIEVLPTTGEFSCESSSGVELEADVDDAEIISTAMMCWSNIEDIFNFVFHVYTIVLDVHHVVVDGA